VTIGVEQIEERHASIPPETPTVRGLRRRSFRNPYRLLQPFFQMQEQLDLVSIGTIPITCRRLVAFYPRSSPVSRAFKGTTDKSPENQLRLFVKVSPRRRS